MTQKKADEIIKNVREGSRVMSIFFRSLVKISDLSTAMLEQIGSGEDIERIIFKESRNRHKLETIDEQTRSIRIRKQSNRTTASAKKTINVDKLSDNEFDPDEF